MQNSKLAYRPDIDGLRAVAVLSVVFCHADFGFQGGFVGVDVFFVISGYLITSLILKDLAQGTFSLVDFWERRIRRILPALLVVTLITMIAGWFLMMPNAYASLGKSVVGLALLVSNVQFWLETGYFQAAAEEKPLLHTWSLAVEEQFYLAVPLFLFLLARIKRIGWASFIFVGSAILSLGLSIRETGGSGNFYLLPTRAWELCVGSLLAVNFTRQTNRSEGTNEITAFVGLASILVPCLIYSRETPFPGLTALPPVLGTAMLIWTGRSCPRLPIVNQILAWQPLVFIGLISYSLYLWHWPLFAFSRYRSLTPLAPSDRLLLLLLSFLLAVISWKYVELPFRHRRFIASRIPLFAVTACTFCFIFGSGLWIWHNEGVASRIPAMSRTFLNTARQEERFNRAHDVDDIPDRLTYLGVPDRTVKFLVWGDSHAMAVLPTIDCICREAGISAHAATKFGTPPVIGWVRPDVGAERGAGPFNDSVMSYIRARAFRSIILVGNWNGYFRHDGFQQSLLNTIDQLQVAGVTVYFMTTVPQFDFDIPKALAFFSSSNKDLLQLGLKVSDYETLNQAENALLVQLTKRNVIILDSLDFLMDNKYPGRLLPFDEQGSIYTDNSHLSTHGALKLKPPFEPVIRAIANDQASD
ncbi:MAG: acyltransferase family protein [Planctomycetaceae bacterium]